MYCSDGFCDLVGLHRAEIMQVCPIKTLQLNPSLLLRRIQLLAPSFGVRPQMPHISIFTCSQPPLQHRVNNSDTSFYLGPIGYLVSKAKNATRFYIVYRVSPKVVIYPPKVVILPPISEFPPQNGSITKKLVIYAHCRQLSQVAFSQCLS